MAETIPNLDGFIQRDQRALRIYLAFGVVLVLLGILVVIASFLPFTGPSNGVRDLLMKIGGGFVSTLGGFPLNEYLKRRDRMDAIRATKELWERLSKSEEPPQDQLDRVKNLAWKMLETAALG